MTLSQEACLLEKTISLIINSKFTDSCPSEDDLMTEAMTVRSYAHFAAVSAEEFEQVIKNLKAALRISMDVGVYIADTNSGHKSWLPSRRAEVDFFYWNRYKQYLENKGWNSRVLASLHAVSDDIVDLLGDPKSSSAWQRRGLVLGDVQSGKTANYTAVCNKAADCGYKVIIVLAGITENLRIQTQERLDKEFAGRQSKHLLYAKGNLVPRNVFDGVGKINASKRISAFTTVLTDFSSTILNSNDMTLKNINEPALFVVKKNKSILKNLERWLSLNNADAQGKIDLPLLLIDDEADNASVNTNDEDQNPTAINTAIRSILSLFSQATYLGITATPFANIFIDPETSSDMIGDDLFPRDFIYVLSAPSNYIGPDAIFGNESTHGSFLQEIQREEMRDFLPSNHKKDVKLDGLPSSLYESMAYFLLINAIRDLRGQQTEHRSMLINISRFTQVQNQIRELVNEWLIRVVSDVQNYACLDTSQSSQVPWLRYLRSVWERHGLEPKAGILWEEMQKKHLYKSIAPVVVRAVNQSTGAASLDYYAHRDSGFRVIAIGGNSLSRGLTLEGLSVSYFYRNSQMYDTLLQMGRWFGYRSHYEDLVKIWMSADAIDWYGYITIAANELKEEIRRMNSLNLTPRDFGLKVRQDPASLIATARNKMRTATAVARPISVGGRLLETPRLKSKPEVLASNKKVFDLFVAHLDAGTSKRDVSEPGYLWRSVPKALVTDLLRGFDCHPWHLAFQGGALAEYIDNNPSYQWWDVTIPKGTGTEIYELSTACDRIRVSPQTRKVSESNGMLMISGTKVRVGSGGCTRAGLSREQIRLAEDKFHSESTKKSVPDSAYLTRELGRNPLLMLHVIETDSDSSSRIPKILYAIGVGLPDTGQTEQIANYVVNIIELRNWVDVEDGDSDDVI